MTTSSVTWPQQSGIRLLVCFAIASATLVDSTMAAEQVSLARVAIYDHSEKLSNGPKNLLRFLTPENGFQCTVVSPADIRSGVLKDFDVLIMPGGSASKQSEKLEEAGREAVLKFVESGHGYVGICAGSYLASSHYPWSLGLVNARVWDRDHWARGKGQVSLCLSAAGCEVLSQTGTHPEVYYGQGPLLAPDTKSHLPGYEVLATYETEVAQKGAPVGAMTGTHAIIRTKYGQGRVICFSPHPEVDGGPNSLMLHGVRWASEGQASAETTPQN